MLFKSPKTRQFAYQPRYYKPEENEEEDEPRIRFRKIRHTSGNKKQFNMRLLLLMIILGFILFYFYQSQRKDNIRDIKKIEINDMR